MNKWEPVASALDIYFYLDLIVSCYKQKVTELKMLYWLRRNMNELVHKFCYILNIVYKTSSNNSSNTQIICFVVNLPWNKPQNDWHDSGFTDSGEN